MERSGASRYYPPPLDRRERRGGEDVRVEQNTSGLAVLAAVLVVGAGVWVLQSYEREKDQQTHQEQQQRIRKLRKHMKKLQQSNDALHYRINDLQEQRTADQQVRVQELENRGLLQHAGQILDRAVGVGVGALKTIGWFLSWSFQRR